MPSSRSPSRPARPRPHPRRRQRGRARARGRARTRGVGGPDRSRRRTQGCACAWGCAQDSAPRSSLRPKLRLRVGPARSHPLQLAAVSGRSVCPETAVLLSSPRFSLAKTAFRALLPKRAAIRSGFRPETRKSRDGRNAWAAGLRRRLAVPGLGSAARANRHGLIVPEGRRLDGRRLFSLYSCAEGNRALPGTGARHRRRRRPCCMLSR